MDLTVPHRTPRTLRLGQAETAVGYIVLSLGLAAILIRVLELREFLYPYTDANKVTIAPVADLWYQRKSFCSMVFMNASPVYLFLCLTQRLWYRSIGSASRNVTVLFVLLLFLLMTLDLFGLYPWLWG